MAKMTICYVVESLEDGPAFAIRVDNDEKVYIPVRLADKHQLEPMDTIKAVLRPNTARPESTQWFAEVVRVIPEGAEV